MLNYAEDERRRLRAGFSDIRYRTRGAAQHNRGIKRKRSIPQTRLENSRRNRSMCCEKRTMAIALGRKSVDVRDSAAREQDYIFCWSDSGGERIGFAGDCAARRAHLRNGARASFSWGEKGDYKVSAARFGGRAGLRDESARGASCRPLRFHLHGREHHGGAAVGTRARICDSRGGEAVVSDQRGDGDLRRERDRGGWADPGGERRRDGRVARSRVHLEFGCAVSFSSGGLRIAYERKPVWVVVGAGDSRHQLRGGSDGEIWTDRAGCRHNDQACPGALDCSAIRGDCGRVQEQGAHTVALVHPVFLHRGTAEYFAASVPAGFRRTESCLEAESDRDAIPDRCEPEQGNPAEGRNSSAAAGTYAVGYRGCQHVGADSVYLDSRVSGAGVGRFKPGGHRGTRRG